MQAHRPLGPRNLSRPHLASRARHFALPRAAKQAKRGIESVDAAECVSIIQQHCSSTEGELVLSFTAAW